jgi:hypothetical protein
VWYEKERRFASVFMIPDRIPAGFDETQHPILKNIISTPDAITDLDMKKFQSLMNKKEDNKGSTSNQSKKSTGGDSQASILESFVVLACSQEVCQ